MTKKTLGHIELHWRCPNCEGINLGSERVCEQCGAPQPDDVEFFQPTRQELLTDEAKIKAAKAGADIHCPYCGTRNPAGTQHCSQCGGDLTEGLERKTGRVVGAYKTGPAAQVSCAQCGTMNPDTNSHCTNCGAALRPEPVPQPVARPQAEASKPRPNRLAMIGLFVVIGLICGGLAVFALLASRTSAVTGDVVAAGWERSVSIEELVPVERESWLNTIPDSAILGACREEVRFVQAEPAERSIEVCGTPYNVDSGGGFAEVVQDCEYHVLDDLCTYTAEEWRRVDTAILSGENYSAAWPDPVLSGNQRLAGDAAERYTILFATEDETLQFQTSDYDLFQRAQVGTTWTLNVNALGTVVSIEP